MRLHFLARANNFFIFLRASASKPWCWLSSQSRCPKNSHFTSGDCRLDSESFPDDNEMKRRQLHLRALSQLIVKRTCRQSHLTHKQRISISLQLNSCQAISYFMFTSSKPRNGFAGGTWKKLAKILIFFSI